MFAVATQTMMLGRFTLKSAKSVLPAWLFLLVFMPQLVVKSLHHHGGSDFSCTHSCAHTSDPSTPSEDQGACAICDFVISVTTEPETFRLCVVTDAPLVEYSTVVEEVAYGASSLPSLRAPPVA